MELSLLILDHFRDLRVSFDLEDCDRILRIESRSQPVPADALIQLLSRAGVQVQVLEDGIASVSMGESPNGRQTLM